MEKKDPFQSQLNNSLQSFKRHALSQQESTKNALKIAEAALISHTNQQSETRKEAEKINPLALQQLLFNSKIAEANFTGKNILTLGTIFSADSANLNVAATNVAKSIELAV